MIFYEPTATSPLDNSDIRSSRSVGSASVFLPRIGKQDLVFKFTNGRFVDLQTGSTWSILGIAVDGTLKGGELLPLIHAQSFWFYWAAINEDTTIYDAHGSHQSAN